MSTKRKRLIGLNIVTLTEGETVTGKFLGTDQQERRNDEPVPYAKFEKIGTGEEFQMWLNAGLKNKLDQAKAKPGMLFEIIYNGKTEFTTEKGDTQMVNNYVMYELE